MKSLVFLLLTCFLTAGALHAQEVPESFGSLLKFDEPNQDLGQVLKGQKKEGVFSFKNVSEEEVTIEFISVCECTEVDYPMHAMAPGEEGEIEFTFDSSEKDKNEVIELEILLVNTEPTTGYQIVETVKYTYDLVLP